MIPGRPRPGRERGASLALVALSLAGLVGMAALVVDVGLGRLTRQTLIPATDAAALAAAQDLVGAPGDETGACATARTYLAGNAPGATMTGCEITSFGVGGRITISAAETVDATFAPAGGSAPRAVGSVSSAAFGPPLTVSELRPIALCYNGSPGLRHLVDDPPTTPTLVAVRFLPDDPAACGGSASVGSFTTVAFDHGASLRRIRRWVRNGYPGEIAFDEPTTTGCDAPATCHQRVDALAAIESSLDSLRNRGSFVAFPLFDFADDTAVHLIGMVRASVVSFRLDGPTQDWFVELQVDPGLITGTCCRASGVTGGSQVIALCGVDPGAVSSCEPETGP